jgi:hypothetical protein
MVKIAVGALKALVFLFLFSASCKQSKKPDNMPAGTSWTRIVILSENRTEVTINNDDDSTKVKFYNYGTFFTGYHKLKVDSTKIFFKSNEKDSLFRWAKTIASDAVESNRRCTDFVGELRIIIDYGSFGSPGTFEQSIKYTGVCDWGALSPAAGKLHNFIGKRIKSWRSPNISHVSY